MVTILANKPKDLFNHLPDDYMWFKLYNDNYIYAYVGIELGTYGGIAAYSP
jgi:hypothetical protein